MLELKQKNDNLSRLNKKKDPDVRGIEGRVGGTESESLNLDPGEDFWDLVTSIETKVYLFGTVEIVL